MAHPQQCHGNDRLSEGTKLHEAASNIAATTKMHTNVYCSQVTFYTSIELSPSSVAFEIIVFVAMAIFTSAKNPPSNFQGRHMFCVFLGTPSIGFARTIISHA